MTDFNSLPLTDQLKALEPGDELHLRGGGWLPFERYDNIGYVVVIWLNESQITAIPTSDIIRVIRPSEKREVPEIVKHLDVWIEAVEPHKANPMKVSALVDLLKMLRNHFESEAKP